jgi:ABC-type sugar transport system ATPase subunit
MMTGKDVAERLDLPAPDPAAPPRLRLSWGEPDRASAISVQPGEILGLAGLVGSGRTEMALGLLGAGALPKAKIEMDGRLVAIESPRQARAMGITYLSEDRKREGLFAPLSILANTTAAALELLSRLGFIEGRLERQAVSEVLERLHTVYRSLDRPATELSGGNQQKILFGRALLAAPRLLICDEPTSGIDVGAKREIHRILLELATLRIGIVMISSELKELRTICHRLAVIRNGQVVAEGGSQDLTDEQMLGLASGLGLKQHIHDPVGR